MGCRTPRRRRRAPRVHGRGASLRGRLYRVRRRAQRAPVRACSNSAENMAVSVLTRVGPTLGCAAAAINSAAQTIVRASEGRRAWRKSSPVSAREPVPSILPRPLSASPSPNSHPATARGLHASDRPPTRFARPAIGTNCRLAFYAPHSVYCAPSNQYPSSAPALATESVHTSTRLGCVRS